MEEQKNLEERISALEQLVNTMAKNLLTALKAHDKKFALIVEQLDEIDAEKGDNGHRGENKLPPG